MAEEQRCQEGHRLCANNCGFFGSPATLNMCSKCYRDYRLKEEQASSAKIAVEKSLSLPSPSSSSSSAAASSPDLETAPAAEAAVVAVPAPSPSVSERPEHQQASRCGACRKKVGLTGFRCRCGETYCGVHRYPERHGCGFDFKAAGRDAIAKANPVVKAEKLEKI